MKCSKQTTDKLGKPKEGKMLAVEALSMQCYWVFFSTECIYKYSCSELQQQICSISK